MREISGYNRVPAELGEQVDGGDSWLVNTETGEKVFLSNRSFETIDIRSNYHLGQYIESLGAAASIESPVRVLDLGCGENSQAVIELQERVDDTRSRVQVYGVDLAAENRTGVNTVLAGDFFHLPWKNDSFDVVYSANALSVIAPGNITLVQNGLSEIACVLKPGGVAFIDFGLNKKEKDFRFYYGKSFRGPMYASIYQLANVAIRFSDLTDMRCYLLPGLPIKEQRGDPDPHVIPLKYSNLLAVKPDAVNSKPEKAIKGAKRMPKVVRMLA